MSNCLPSQGPVDVTARAEPTENLSADLNQFPQTMFRIVSPTQVKAKRDREVHPPEVWQSLKGTIKYLYLEEGKPLREVMHIMQQRHNFKS
jgi:hypothetical protein